MAFRQTQVPDEMTGGTGASDYRCLSQDPLGLLLFARRFTHHDILAGPERCGLRVYLRL